MVRSDGNKTVSPWTAGINELTILDPYFLGISFHVLTALPGSAQVLPMGIFKTESPCQQTSQ
jgi:hypothetical protein